MKPPTKKQAVILMRLYEGEREPFCPLIVAIREGTITPKTRFYIQIKSTMYGRRWGLYHVAELTTKMLNPMKKKGYIAKGSMDHSFARQTRRDGNKVEGVFKLSHAGKRIGRIAYLSWELTTCIRHEQEEHQRHEQEIKRLKARRQYLTRTLKSLTARKEAPRK